MKIMRQVKIFKKKKLMLLTLIIGFFMFFVLINSNIFFIKGRDTTPPIEKLPPSDDPGKKHEETRIEEEREPKSTLREKDFNFEILSSNYQEIRKLLKDELKKKDIEESLVEQLLEDLETTGKLEDFKIFYYKEKKKGLVLKKLSFVEEWLTTIRYEVKYEVDNNGNEREIGRKEIERDSDPYHYVRNPDWIINDPFEKKPEGDPKLNSYEGWKLIENKDVKIEYISSWYNWYDWIKYKIGGKSDEKWISEESWARNDDEDFEKRNIKNWSWFKKEFSDLKRGWNKTFKYFAYWVRVENKDETEIVPVWWKEEKEENNIQKRIFSWQELKKNGLEDTINIATFSLPKNIGMVETHFYNFVAINTLPFWKRVLFAKATNSYNYWLGDPSFSYYDEKQKLHNVYYDRFISPVLFEIIQFVLTAGLFSELKIFSGSQKAVVTATRNAREAEIILDVARTNKRWLSSSIAELTEELTRLENKVGDTRWSTRGIIDWIMYPGGQIQYTKDVEMIGSLKKIISDLERELEHVIGSIPVLEGTVNGALRILDGLLSAPQRAWTYFESKLIQFFDWLNTYEAIRPILYEIRNFFNMLMTSYAVKTIGNFLMFFLFNDLYSSIDVTIG